jgi:glycosyltransferase involved in cell wall biosynthesis
MVFEYNKADILINFSDFEGGPQTFVEAALCEIPTLIRYNNELAKNIPCFTGKNEDDFISILSYLKENRDLCVKKGKEAYNVTINNFTYKHAAKKFANFFVNVATQK